MGQVGVALMALQAVGYLFFSSMAAGKCEFTALLNFGDSNSDTGGLSAAFGPAPSPNGETFFHRPAGRYCDGRLLIDFIAEELGMPHIDAYLNSVGSNFSHGANFATAGSTVRKQNSTLFQSGFSPFSLDVQTWQFSQFKNRSQRARLTGSVFRRLLPEESAFSSALYAFDIGMNDLTSAFFSNLTVDEVLNSIPAILGELTVALKSVYWEGGRFFWIHNAGPIGCLAYVLERLSVKAEDVDSAGCAEKYNAVARAFNAQLNATVAELRDALPLAALTYIDVYAAKYSLFSRPPSGFTKQPLVACCGHGGRYNYSPGLGCGTEQTVNGTRTVLAHSCADPSKMIVWDGVHYTEAANRWIFDQISSGNFSNPTLPLQFSCSLKPSVS
ncbi:alpha-fucosidase 1 [Wolffia australiana]